MSAIFISLLIPSGSPVPDKKQLDDQQENELKDSAEFVAQDEAMDSDTDNTGYLLHFQERKGERGRVLYVLCG